MVFCAWLPSFGTMFSRSIHVQNVSVVYSFSWLNTPPASLRTQECLLKDLGATALKNHHQETKQGPHSSPDSKLQNFLNVMGCVQLPIDKGFASFL